MLGNGDAGVQQGAVLLVVVGVAVQQAPPGELGDLFADQALFVKAVAKAFVHAGQGVVQGLKLSVGGGPVAAAAKVWVGDDEAGGVGMDGKQAVVGQDQGARNGGRGGPGRGSHADRGVVGVQGR
ncbi:hypothetical protein LPH55_00010 [Xylella taiwanensis]|uniref:Uncharacterized protein n=1 Tax=Xylella taiwanensis TaxID=1444770 RepID=A0ABS8TPZ7_9GAMM|nr:hypothetical protein [Xylella taiwanensis]MCD8461357.1 hypothetical protein [Xylella taiwanensis]MCD8469380.1 hypothetical protein [Xylella taiwanensis]MCD8471896.1 hypothetical protein [Xylella taiwanensis]